jgi:hypothetical protein
MGSVEGALENGGAISTDHETSSRAEDQMHPEELESQNAADERGLWCVAMSPVLMVLAFVKKAAALGPKHDTLSGHDCICWFICLLCSHLCHWSQRNTEQWPWFIYGQFF